jgi:uncharacterized RDD family membrane protein YckC
MIQNDASANSSSGARPSPIVVELAGLRRRFASMVYESMLMIGVLAGTVIFPWMIALWLLDLREASTWRGAVMGLHLLAVMGIYFVWYWHRHGQTLAMQTWRLKVVSVADGRNPSWRRACLRYALALPSVLGFGIGLIWGVLDLDKVFLHDRLAGTRIVLLPPMKKH